MRKLRKNDKWLYYANLEETKTEYLIGEDGYEKTVIVNGEARLIETGANNRVFGTPVRFLGHITPTGIETYAHGNESTQCRKVLIPRLTMAFYRQWLLTFHSRKKV